MNVRETQSTMDISSKYWKICQISLTRTTTGYEYRLLPTAQAFFQTQFSDALQSDNKQLQSALLSLFHGKSGAIVTAQRAQAGLCLRCSISTPILKACQKIDYLYSGDKQFTYQDLLPLVLNDDGKALVILDDESKIQLKLDEAGKTQPVRFELFAIEVLRSFKAESSSSMSLDNWAFFKTKQHPELKKFLSEFGFQSLSDWALLNRVRIQQLEQLSERDRHLVQVFHQVYRRDRRQQPKLRKCADPTVAQLTEMSRALEGRGLSFLSLNELLKALKQVAQQLRQHDIWSQRVPLEVPNTDTGHYELRQDLPTQSNEEEDIDRQEFLTFLHQQTHAMLIQAIAQAIETHIKQLEKSKKYAPFAASFLKGLQLYYCEGISLREIAPLLGMSSWDQARRILNPGELLSKIRTLTVQPMFDQILKQVQVRGLAATPTELNYLKRLAEQVEAFLDTEIFAEAATEIKAGKNRSMDSIYAQHLKRYIQQHI